MTRELFCEILGDVDADYILEAWGDRGEGSGAVIGNRETAGCRWLGMAAAVALFLIAGAGLVFWIAKRGEPETPPKDLPVLALTQLRAEGMGFEGLLYNDVSELSGGNKNPWREDRSELSVMPVYQNGTYDPKGLICGLGREEILKRLETAADIMGLDASNWRQMPSYGQGNTIQGLYVEGNGLRIEAESNGTITVFFEGGLTLPEQYHFTHTESTDDEAEAVMAYLVDCYSQLLDFAQPEIVVKGERHMDGTYSRRYRVYDRTGDETEHILNYCFHYVEFAPDNNGNLMCICLTDSLAVAEKISDYPLITAEEARQKLLAGEYLTTVPYPLPGEDSIALTELVYRSGRMEENYLPYYRFYVELPDGIYEMDGAAAGLKMYGVYYVPAVSPQYISIAAEGYGMIFQ